jgi:hypothetical protein
MIKFIEPYGGGQVSGVVIKKSYLIERNIDRYFLRVRHQDLATRETYTVDVTDDAGPWWDALSDNRIDKLLVKVRRVLDHEVRDDIEEATIRRDKDIVWKALIREQLIDEEE